LESTPISAGEFNYLQAIMTKDRFIF